MSVRVQDSCCKELFRSNARGQLQQLYQFKNFNEFGAKQPRASFSACATIIGVLSASAEGWVWCIAARLRNLRRRGCKFVPLEKWNAPLFKTTLPGINGEATKILAVGRGPTKQEIQHRVVSGHAEHRTWCDACMRAHGRHEKREPGRYDSDLVVAMDYVYLNLRMARKMMMTTKLHRTNCSLVVAKDVKTGTHAATCLHEARCVSMPCHGMVFLLRRQEYRRAILPSDGEPSIVSLNTSTLWAVPFVEFVCRGSPFGEHATNGVVESSMRPVRRQTRTLKFAPEDYVGTIFESRPHPWRVSRRATDAISFLRRSGNYLEESRCRVRIAEFGESVFYTAVAWAVASGTEPQFYGGRYLGHHARTTSILIMTTDGEVEAAGF